MGAAQVPRRIEGQTIWSEIYGSRSITPIQEMAECDAGWLMAGKRIGSTTSRFRPVGGTVPPATNFGDGSAAENIWNDQLELVMVGQHVVRAVQAIAELVNGDLKGP